MIMKKGRLIYIIYYLSILLYICSIFSNNNLGLLIIIFIYAYGYRIQNKVYMEKGDLLNIIKTNIYVILLVFLINLIYYKSK